MTKPTVDMYCDGASLPTNGEHGGVGVVLMLAGRADTVKEFSRYVGSEVTNNSAELCAVIFGLEQLTKPCSVRVVSDSQYVVNIGNGDWRAKANLDLWERYRGAVTEGKHDVTFKWVKGHDGNQYNERSHELAEFSARSRGK